MTVMTVFSNTGQKTKYRGNKNIVTIDTTVMGAENSAENPSGNAKNPFTRKSAIGMCSEHRSAHATPRQKAYCHL